MKRLVPLLFALLLIAGCATEETLLSSSPEGRDVALTAEDGVGLKGTFYPGGSDGVILLHMLEKDRNSWGSFPATLNAEGYSVLAIDLRGHGESALDARGFTANDFNSMTRDVKAAKDFLTKEGADSIYIIGASIGANTALNYAASDKSVRAVVLLSPGLDYRGVNTGSSIKTYGGRELLIVASEGDSYSADSSRRLDSVARSSELMVYPGNEHGTNMFASKPLDELIVQWLNFGGCRKDDDCVPDNCCHAYSCTTKDRALDCSDALCTMDCAPGTMDCGQGSCKCVDDVCKAVFV